MAVWLSVAEAQPEPCEAPTLADGRVDGVSDVKRVGESALRLLFSSCGWSSRLGNGTAHVPEVQRLVALCQGASDTHPEWLGSSLPQ